MKNFIQFVKEDQVAERIIILLLGFWVARLLILFGVPWWYISIPCVILIIGIFVYNYRKQFKY